MVHLLPPLLLLLHLFLTGAQLIVSRSVVSYPVKYKVWTWNFTAVNSLSSKRAHWHIKITMIALGRESSVGWTTLGDAIGISNRMTLPATNRPADLYRCPSLAAHRALTSASRSPRSNIASSACHRQSTTRVPQVKRGATSKAFKKLLKNVCSRLSRGYINVSCYYYCSIRAACVLQKLYYVLTCFDAPWSMQPLPSPHIWYDLDSRLCHSG